MIWNDISDAIYTIIISSEMSHCDTSSAQIFIWYNLMNDAAKKNIRQDKALILA